MIQITEHQPTEHSEAALYDALNQQLLGSTFGATAAEAHGLAAGLACRDFSRDQLLEKLALFGFDADTEASFWSLLEMVDRDLREVDFKFDLWLPDNTPLAERTAALGNWCHGFVLGLCHDGQSALQGLSTEMREAFDDLVAISGAESESDEPDAEAAFVQVSEYVRVSVQLLFEELKPQAQPAVSDEPS